MKKIIAMLFFGTLAAFMTGCQTMKATPAPSETAMEYRGLQEELQARQTETAITGVRIEAGSREIVAGLDALESAMVAAPESGVDWLPPVQALKVRAGELQGEAETLNRQLAGERENNGRLGAKFNDYEAATIRDLAVKEGEINTLRVENKKLSGQRNTLLAIVITAVSIIVIFIAIKLLRALRILPI